jgi:poly(A) polymerase
MIKDIWELQSRLVQLNRRQAQHCLHHARFRAAYDFLVLRARTEPELVNIANFWTEIQELPDEARKEKIHSLPGRKAKSSRKGNRKPKSKTKGVVE